MYTASTAFLEALTEAGIGYIFANWGSDHPALIEALAEARATGRAVPAVITCPNEMVALSAAHGFAQVSGQPRRCWCMWNAAPRRWPAQSTMPIRAGCPC